jgi:predicted transcriptional regulator
MSKPKQGRELTRRERQIMDILHRRGRATAHQVLEDLADPPSYSSVRALLRLLEERGHVRHAIDGQAYVYSPAASRSDARRGAISHLISTFFGGSAREAVATLVQERKLSHEELDEISALIEHAREGGRRR